MRLLTFFLGIHTLFLVCWAADVPEPKERISQETLYSDVKKRTADPKNLLYSPQYPLWSDGARKRRWISLPPGTQIDTSKMNQWKFPVGTRLWKEFAYPIGNGEFRAVETRLIQKVSNHPTEGWQFYTYFWRADQSDADLDEDGKGKADFYKVSEKSTHDVPTATDCASCHRAKGEPILGVTALQLSWDRDPLAPHTEELTKEMVTLRELMDKKLVTHTTDNAAKIPSRSKEERAALGYIHANCGSCHTDGGNGMASGLLMAHAWENNDVTKEPIFLTGLNKPNSRFPEKPYRIEGGSPKNSSLISRMQVEGKVFPRMPNLGSKVLDEDAIKLLSKWVEGLPKP